MALSLLSRMAPKAARTNVAKKPTGTRLYSSHAHHEVGPVEKRILNTRVVFPSPLGRSNVHMQDEYALAMEQHDKNAATTPEAQHEVMTDRLKRFRQAILDAHEVEGIEYESDLAPNEFPSGPLTLKGSFGTPDQPMLVPSFEQERLVGCQGGAGPRHHELLWHNLKKNKPLACLECGQIFRLVDHMEWLEWAATEWDLNKQDTIRFFIPESE